MASKVHFAAGIVPNDPLSRYAFGFAFIASAAGLVSIALSHACLAVALVLLLASKTRLRLPPIAWPLGGFLGLTVLSALASDNPAAAFPQLKKFFVFTILVVIFSLFPRVEQAQRLMEAWFVLTLAAAVVSLVQFGHKLAAAQAAHEDFLTAYAPNRITGFFSHWMTFSQTGLLVFLVLAGYLLFSRSAQGSGRAVWFACGVVFGASLVLSFTRSVWLALLVAGGYLVWNWNKKWLLAVPLLLALVFVAAPGAGRRRLESMVSPDANSARLIMWRTGWRMIQAHPALGLGPERVGPRFREFLPADVAELPNAYYGHLHNMYIHYAAERGLPAAAMLVWLLGHVLWDHRRALRKLPEGPSDRRFLLHAVVAATLGIAVVGCFDLTLGDSEILAAFLALVALGYRTVESLNQQPA